jgi:adenosylmethionine-8-amino-7-oxononanoate aminotransferase
VNLFGHGHPRIKQAIKQQLDEVEHVILAGFTHKPVIELSERLSALTGLGHVFYASDGASATEIALKMSFHYWKNIGQPEKCRFISLDNSYHGETAGALAVTDVPLFSATYAPLLKPGVRAIAGCETGPARTECRRCGHDRHSFTGKCAGKEGWRDGGHHCGAAGAGCGRHGHVPPGLPANCAACATSIRYI